MLLFSKCIDEDDDDMFEKSWNVFFQAKLNFGTAKNVIFFLGDGMGFSTTSAARIYHAQSRKLMGENAKLSFERFQHAGQSIVSRLKSMFLKTLKIKKVNNKCFILQLQLWSLNYFYILVIQRHSVWLDNIHEGKRHL